MDPFDPPTDERPERAGVSLVAVVRHDALAAAGVFLAIAFWGVHALVLGLVASGGGGGWVDTEPSLALPLTATALGLVLIAARFTRIQGVVARGSRASAEITDRLMHRGIGRLYVRFAIDQGEITTWSSVRDAGRVRELERGERVEVAYDPEAPGVAFIVALYS